MRIAHISDLHVFALEQVGLRRLLRGKRIQGYANLMLKRRREHDNDVARRVLGELRAQRPDLIAITGDVTNLSTDEEFAAAHELIAAALRDDCARVLIVPGNHDAYTRDAWARGSFERVFGAWQRCDPPCLRSEERIPYPVLRIEDHVAILGLSSAVPRGAFVASGELGVAQLDDVQRLLQREDVDGRALLVLVHHPVAGMRGPFRTWLRGMRDATALLDALGDRRDVLILHGHLHRPVFHRIAGRAGDILVSGVTSASLSARAHQRAGFQVVEHVRGRWSVTRFAYDPRSDTFDANVVT